VPRDLLPNGGVAPETKKARLEDKASPSERAAPLKKPTIPLDACLKAWAAEGPVDDFFSSATGVRGTASRSNRMKTCPRYLLLKLNRYYVTETWEPKKLDVLVDAPLTLDLSALRAPASRPPGEESLPEEEEEGLKGAPSSKAFAPDEAVVAQLVTMGFDENGCRRACAATKNAGPEAAMEWVFGHMGDADFATPYDPAPPPEADAGPDEAAITTVVALGFTRRQAEGALKACDNSA